MGIMDKESGSDNKWFYVENNECFENFIEGLDLKFQRWLYRA